MGSRSPKACIFTAGGTPPNNHPQIVQRPFLTIWTGMAGMRANNLRSVINWTRYETASIIFSPSPQIKLVGSEDFNPHKTSSYFRRHYQRDNGYYTHFYIITETISYDSDALTFELLSEQTATLKRQLMPVATTRIQQQFLKLLTPK